MRDHLPHWITGRWARALAISLPAVVGGLLAAFFVLDALFPPNLTRFSQTSREVRAADGSLLRLFPVEDGLLRQQVTLADVDPLFINMLLAYEDRRFYDHPGVDPLAVLRATGQALRAGEVVSGASTLTMQTARLLEPRPRTLSAKLAEMFRAVQLERRFSKAQILEMYLTLAPYGGNVEGIRAASHALFGHAPNHLSPAEAALLVVLPQSPARLQPDRHPQAAKTARNKVLTRVANRVGLDAHRADLSRRASVPVHRHTPPLLAAHLSETLATGPSRDPVHTYIDPALQTRLEALAANTARLVHPKASAAILVLDSHTRQVLAWVGSAGYTDADRTGYVDMVRAVRSPGSTLKPLIYGLAMDRGQVHPLTRIRDEPRRFGTYAPSNFMDVFHGEVSVGDALRLSLNVPAVAVLDRLGPVTFTETLRDAGTPLHLPDGGKPGLAVALGGVGTTLENLVRLYAALADDGRVLPLVLTTSASAAAPPADPQPQPLINARTRDALRATLSLLNAPGNRLPANLQRHPRPIAYKTGTSYGYRDAWAIGYDSRYTIGVWIGRPDGTPLPGHMGANTAAPVLFDAFDGLPQDPPAPATVHSVTAFTDLPPALQYFDAPAFATATSRRSAPLDVMFPPTGSVVAWTDTAPPVALSATGGALPLQWFVNGQPLPTRRWSRDTHYAPPSAGFYQATVVDSAGARRSVDFTVSAPESASSQE